MLTDEDRESLRQLSVLAWDRAKHLTEMAATLTGDSQQIRSDSRAHVLQARHLRGAAVRRVDLVLEEDPAPVEPAPPVPGIGLVVASRVERGGGLHDVLHRRLGRVWTARDPAVAVGLAITTQPDVALVDDELPMMSGLDLALLLRSYAPATPVILLTDDPRTARQARWEGLPTGVASDPEDQLLRAIERLVA